MTTPESNKKRKAITKDSVEADEVVLSDGTDGLEPGFLDSVLSQSEDEGSDGSESDALSLDGDDVDDFEDSGDDLMSEEVPSDVDSGGHVHLKVNGSSESGPKLLEASGDELQPNHVVTQDANGNPRYVYRDIDPVYDSDDSDAPETTNTI
ncbi:MAG: hypothetical protein L6R35_007592, partial [Caloplaca aegaea]